MSLAPSKTTVSRKSTEAETPKLSIPTPLKSGSPLSLLLSSQTKAPSFRTGHPRYSILPSFNSDLRKRSPSELITLSNAPSGLRNEGLLTKTPCSFIYEKRRNVSTQMYLDTSDELLILKDIDIKTRIAPETRPKRKKRPKVNLDPLEMMGNPNPEVYIERYMLKHLKRQTEPSPYEQMAKPVYSHVRTKSVQKRPIKLPGLGETLNSSYNTGMSPENRREDARQPAKLPFNSTILNVLVSCVDGNSSQAKRAILKKLSPEPKNEFIFPTLINNKSPNQKRKLRKSPRKQGNCSINRDKSEVVKVREEGMESWLNLCANEDRRLEYEKEVRRNPSVYLITE